MKHYNELGHVYRTEPCIEYPGKWIVYYPGRNVKDSNTFPSFTDAYNFASTKEGHFPTDTFMSDTHVSICWECSEDDPRQGEVWFTPFYQHGKFDRYGRYKS